MNEQDMNKQHWVQLFRDIGLDENTMKEWHRKFEARHPHGHQSFLEWLGIAEDEIRSIRAM